MDLLNTSVQLSANILQSVSRIGMLEFCLAYIRFYILWYV